jgi:hypothetical protein
MMSYWWAAMGVERPAYGLVHDTALAIPGLRSFLTKLGALPATRENGDRVLDAGAPLLLYPGGDLDCLKSFWTRHTVDFHGAPASRPRAQARRAHRAPRLRRRARGVRHHLLEPAARALDGRRTVHACEDAARERRPALGHLVSPFVPYLPLPAKFTYRVGPPIDFGHDPDAAEDPFARRVAAARVTRTMQAMLDELVARRRRPILG